MFCKVCGKEVLDEAVICPHCGCSVQEAAPAEEPAPRKVNVLCLLGFILACVSWLLDIFCLISLAGTVLSIVGVVQAMKNGDRLKGLGIAGIPVGVVAFILNLIGLLIL